MYESQLSNIYQACGWILKWKAIISKKSSNLERDALIIPRSSVIFLLYILTYAI